MLLPGVIILFNVAVIQHHDIAAAQQCGVSILPFPSAARIRCGHIAQACHRVGVLLTLYHKYWRPVSDRRRHFRQVVQCTYPYFIWDTPHIPVPGFWGVRPVLPLTKGFDLLPIRIQLFKSANLEQNRAITVCIVIGIGQLS